MQIETHVPAPREESEALHLGLLSAGQTLPDAQMPTFLLAVRGVDGALVAGCKGELTFATAHVSELWVDESARGRGLGGRLLDAAEDHARRHGCTRLHLETRNPKAKTLYERQGYSVFGTLPDYDGDIPFWYLVKALA